MKNMANVSAFTDTELLKKAANNKLNSEPETEEMQITGSPFKAIREKEGGWFAAWGQGKMTEEFPTVDELLQWIEDNYWNFLITVLTMVMDSRDLYKIDQMMKRAKEERTTPQRELAKLDKQRMEEFEATQREHRLHMEIERLKEEEAYKARVEQNMEFFINNM